MCLPGDAVRERATSSHGMVREGVYTHTLGTGGEGSPLSTDTRVKQSPPGSVLRNRNGLRVEGTRRSIRRVNLDFFLCVWLVQLPFNFFFFF